jgi:two-component system, chemotaxis family, chemotaxis protein CheY
MARILVIEDSAYQRLKISKVLSSAGHLVIQAADGREGLLTAAASEPELVLLDLLMPSMGGLEVLQELHDKHLSLPVIVLTADIQETTRQHCLDLGAMGFLTKPLKPEELLEIVSKAVQAKAAGGIA